VQWVEQGIPVAGDDHSEFVQFVAHGFGRAPDAGTAGPPHAGPDEEVSESLALGQDGGLILSGRELDGMNGSGVSLRSLFVPVWRAVKRS